MILAERFRITLHRVSPCASPDKCPGCSAAAGKESRECRSPRVFCGFAGNCRPGCCPYQEFGKGFPRSAKASLPTLLNPTVSKPIRRRELLAAFGRLFPSAVTAGTESPVQSEPAFDRAKLLDEIGGNIRLFRRLATVHFEHTPALHQTIQAAASSGQMPELQRAAHTLKGSLIQFVARSAMRSAARTGDATVASPAAELIFELERFDRRLRQFLGEV